MPPEAELRETKCPFVVEKVKLVTLIYPGRRRHRRLELVSLAPGGRAREGRPKPGPLIRGKVAVNSWYLYDVWLLIKWLRRSHVWVNEGMNVTTDSHLRACLMDASGFRDPARHAGKSQNPTRYKSIGLNRGWAELVWISWGFGKDWSWPGPGLAFSWLRQVYCGENHQRTWWCSDEDNWSNCKKWARKCLRGIFRNVDRWL